MNSFSNPPKILLRIFRWFCNPDYHEDIEGDLIERYGEYIEEKGLMRGKIWFFFQIVRLLRKELIFPMEGYKHLNNYGMLKNFIKVSIRVLWKQKNYTAINILGLSLGIGCFITISLWVNDELRVDKFHDDLDNLFILTQERSGGSNKKDIFIPSNWAPLVKDRIPGVKRISRVSSDFPSEVVVGNDENSFHQKGIYVDSSFFEMFSFKFLEGNQLEAFDHPKSIIITDDLANKLFDDQHALGQTITVNRKEDQSYYTISGVIESNEHSSMQFDFVANFDDLLGRNDWLSKWGSHSITTFVQTHSNVTSTEVRSQLEMISKDGVDSFNSTFKLDVFEFKSFYLKGIDLDGPDFLRQGSIVYVRLFSFIVLFILIMACINYINLTTARASLRTQEVGLRKALGAHRSALVGQFMTESFMVLSLSVIISLTLCYLLLPFVNSMVNVKLGIPFGSTGFWLSVLITFLVMGICAGLYPSIISASLVSSRVAISNLNRKSQRYTFTQGLIVFQFSLSILLILATYGINHQIRFIRNSNLGFQKDNIVSFPLNRDLISDYEAFYNELVQLPYVKNATRASNSPGEINGSSPDIWWQGKPENDQKSFKICHVDEAFQETFNLALVDGRFFSPMLKTDENNYVLNEQAIRHMGIQDPIGKEIYFWKGKGKIIGVVKDFHHESLHAPIEPVTFMLWPENADEVFVNIAGNNVIDEIEGIESVFKKISPDNPFNPDFLDARYQALYEKEILAGKLVRLFGLAAIIISCLGLIGLTTFGLKSKEKEMTIRKVFGATVNQLYLNLTKSYLKLMTISILIVLPISYYLLSEWLNNFAYHIKLNGIILFLIGISIIPIMLIVISWQTLKLAKANPVATLRNE